MICSIQFLIKRLYHGDVDAVNKKICYKTDHMIEQKSRDMHVWKRENGVHVKYGITKTNGEIKNEFLEKK